MKSLWILCIEDLIENLQILASKALVLLLMVRDLLSSLQVLLEEESSNLLTRGARVYSLVLVLLP